MRISNSTPTNWYWPYTLGLEWMQAAVTMLNTSYPVTTSNNGDTISSVEKFEVVGACYKITEGNEDFVSMVAHELRTPLTSIRAFSEILQNNPDMDVAQRTRFLDIIIQESEKLSEIVDQTLDLVKVEAESFDWSLGKVDFIEVFDTCLETIKSQAKSSKMQIEVRLPKDIPPVYANPDRLAQAILILLSEAIKYADDDSGWIGIRARVEADTLQVDIHNNGSISPLKHKYQQSQSRSDSFYRTEYSIPNLNLIACHDLLAQYGGQLSIEPGTPHGLKFTFTLPLSKN